MSPDWPLPFEAIWVSSGVAVGVILGQTLKKILHLIYYPTKALNPSQKNYTMSEKELLLVVFTFEKVWSYLFGTKFIIHTDHSLLRYLMEKKDVKPGLIRWVLLLQESDFKVKDQKGIKNRVLHHLSHLKDKVRLKLEDEVDNDTL